MPNLVQEATQPENSTVAAFLEFLAQDIARFPQQLRPLDPVLMQAIDQLVSHMSIDINEDFSAPANSTLPDPFAGLL